MDVVAIDAHELGQGQGRGELGELGRLEAYGTNDNPGVGALDAMRIEDSGKEQQEHEPIE